jgi:hypothetical protein
MTKKNDTNSPVGSHGGKDPLRNWSMGSYNADTGRSHSSIAEDGGKGPLHSNYAGECNPQIPSFADLDKRRSQDPRPVRTREFTRRFD